MLGPDPQTHGAIASVVGTYRTHGLFRRWSIDYLATHSERGLRRNAKLASSALRRFALLLLQERGLVVHLHASAQHGFWREALFMMLALAARRPVILHLHGAGFDGLHDAAGPLGRRILRLLLERAACVVVACESMRAWVAGVSRGAQPICLPTPLAPAAPAQEGRRPSLVLFMSSLAPANGIFDLLEAIAAVRSVVPDVRLVCAGEGDRAAVLQHAERLGIADAVKLTGWVGPSGKRALLENAAVFALPAYDAALPLSVLEAMAAGVPVIAAPLGGIPEVIADGVTGLLAAPGDVATLQRHLRKLLMDRKLAARIGGAARESVARRCAPERALGKLGALYATLGLQARGDEGAPLAAADLNEAA